MRDARLWGVLFAFMSFLGGGAAGLLYARERFGPTPVEGPFVHYERLLSAHFALDPARARILRGLLWNYQEEIDRLRDRHTAELLSVMEPELRDHGLRYRNIIRNELLSEQDREEFDRLVREYVVHL